MSIKCLVRAYPCEYAVKPTTEELGCRFKGVEESFANVEAAIVVGTPPDSEKLLCCSPATEAKATGPLV